MDSYPLPLSTYATTDPLVDSLNKHWKYVIHNGQSLQSLYSQSCGDYALMYLRARARGQSMDKFVRRFSKHDYEHNDHKVGLMLKTLIESKGAYGRLVDKVLKRYQNNILVKLLLVN